MKNILCI